MVVVYRYQPAWTVPCVSPFVTKVIYFLIIAGIPFEVRRQDLRTLDVDSPRGQLPYIELTDGRKIADSTDIIQLLRNEFGDPIDSDASCSELANMHAWNRMIDEHLYWAAVIFPRWMIQSNWDIYRPLVEGNDVKFFDEGAGHEFRKRILNRFANSGWNRYSTEELSGRARADVDAISNFLGEKAFFMGDKAHWIDASILAILRHIIDAPFTFDTKSYAEKKANLISYMARMKNEYGI